QSPRITQIARHAEKAAEVQCTVLITGETGTGKELWARALHKLGGRRDKPLVPVNCAALTPTLAESQLFGHEKGAFTGASGQSAGVFRAAEGGVVFLDEVGEMPLELQPKLLRVLQEAEVTPVGASRPVRVNVQVIAATNRDLEREVSEGLFREDLYYRLNMVELKIPALRERIEDLPQFVRFFSEKFSKRYNRDLWEPTTEKLQELCDFPWPGNLRQLAHVIEQAYVLDCEPSLPNRKPSDTQAPVLPFTNLARLREAAVRQALRSTGGHKGHAARLLGVHANTMTRLLAQLSGDESSEQNP
ncbi:MAG: sigma-54-dependent Fis family transcriptional regulator, partial [Planctomycetaceae bacterium]|nr:sigma-54-dependent Fis family transcriptional regulator [Planctomycetaceae bacterium]